MFLDKFSYQKITNEISSLGINILIHHHKDLNRKNTLFLRNGLRSITDGIAWFYGVCVSYLVSVTWAEEYSKARLTLPLGLKPLFSQLLYLI